MHDNMSVGVSSMPPWKQAIIEKRRRQDGEDRQKQLEDKKRISEMPAWKREIVIRKRQQKNSLVFLSESDARNNSSCSEDNRSKSSDGSISRSPCSASELDAINNVGVAEGVDERDNFQVQQHCLSPLTCNTNGYTYDSSTTIDTSSLSPVRLAVEEEDEERKSQATGGYLPHIQCNPWLKSDIAHQQQHKPCPKSSNVDEEQSANGTISSDDVSRSTHALHHAPDHNDNYNNDDEVFKETEVPYGKGFVHKLMERFKTLTTKIQGDVKSYRVKRAQSSDFLSNSPSRSASNGTTSNLLTMRAHSLEDLCCLSTDGSEADKAEPVYSTNSLGRRPKLKHQLYSGDILDTIHMNGEQTTVDPDGFQEATTTNAVSSNTDDSAIVLDGSSDEDATVNMANIVDKFEKISSAVQNVQKRTAPTPPVKPVLANPYRAVSSYNKSPVTTTPPDDLSNSANNDALNVQLTDSQKQIQTELLPAGTSNTIIPDNALSDTSAVVMSNGTPLTSTVTPSAIVETVRKSSVGVTVNPGALSKKRTDSAVVDDVPRTKSVYQDSKLMYVHYKNEKAELPVRSVMKKRRAPLPPLLSAPSANRSASVEDTPAETEVDVVRDIDVMTSAATINGEDHMPLLAPLVNNDELGEQNVETADTTGHDDYLASVVNERQSIIQDDNSRSMSLEIAESVVDAKRQKNGEDLQQKSSREPVKFPSNNGVDSRVNSQVLLHNESVDKSKRQKNGVDLQNQSICELVKSASQPIRESVKSASQPIHESVKSASQPIHESVKSASQPIHESVKSASQPIRESVKSASQPIRESVKSASQPIRESVKSASSGSLDSSANSYVSPFGGAVLRKVKPAVVSGQGSMLIRPASNLVHANTNRELINLTGYKDIKTGEFAPPKKRPSYYDDDDDEDDDIPVTDIDNYLGNDIPVTNIDDLMGAPLSPREGTTADVAKRVKYSFTGAEVHVGRSLLLKTPGRKVSSLQSAVSTQICRQSSK